MHTVKASGSRSSKATPKHRSTSTMFDCRDRVLFSEGLILFSVNCFTKNSILVSSVHRMYSQNDFGFPRKVLANSSLAFLCLCQQWGPPGSPTTASHFIQMATDSAS